MSATSFDEILIESDTKCQALKYLPHWPPVNIDFEDVVYTVQNGMESEYDDVELNFHIHVLSVKRTNYLWNLLGTVNSLKSVPHLN